MCFVVLEVVRGPVDRWLDPILSAPGRLCSRTTSIEEPQSSNSDRGAGNTGPATESNELKSSQEIAGLKGGSK